MAKRSAQWWLGSLAVVLSLAGCARSISNSGYEADSDRGYRAKSNPTYKGELNEWDVLGIDPQAVVTEKGIADALASKVPLTLPKGSTVMLVQSGAPSPDDDLNSSLAKYFNVSVFSGVPLDSQATHAGYSKALRLAAAQGGAPKLMVVWGVLETGRLDLDTKAVSWIPFVGWGIRDEVQRMRIRTKVAIVDVKTGQWETFAPEPFEDSSSSSNNSRAATDQAQVAVLKTRAYKTLVEDLVKRYAR